MKIDKDIQPYLNGERFSNSLKYHIKEKFSEKKRIEILSTMAKGKKIIHMGCLDHIPLIEMKIMKNIWLHGILSEASDSCLGIDINKEGVDYVRDKLKIQNVVYGDILKDDLLEIEKYPKWDFIILGEILEHVDDPVCFLKNIKKKYEGKINQIVVTVPNVLNFHTFKYLKNNTEHVNSDHRYWFTPYTILKVVGNAGFVIDNIEFSNRISLNKKQLLLRKLASLINYEVKYPFSFYQSIVITASF